MKLKDPRITFLVGVEGTTIQIHDNASVTNFIEIKLTPEQLSSALSRLAYTRCEVNVRDLDIVGKKRLVMPLIFEIPKDYDRRANEALLNDLAIQHTPVGWTTSTYFGSQDSFFTEDGKRFARTSVYQWVEDQDEN